MEGISDLKIIGFDELRPPVVLKEPYINLYYKLSHKAPKEWCAEFNEIASKSSYAGKIKLTEGLFIETWVRNPDEIGPSLDGFKKVVKSSIEKYIAKIHAKANEDMTEQQGASVSKEQAHLNSVVSCLDFDS